MAEAEMETMLVEIATAFERISKSYVHTLTTVKAHVLSNKARVADILQIHLDRTQRLVDELQPLIRGMQQLEKKPTAKKPLKQAPRAQKAGVRAWQPKTLNESQQAKQTRSTQLHGRIRS